MRLAGGSGVGVVRLPPLLPPPLAAARAATAASSTGANPQPADYRRRAALPVSQAPCRLAARCLSIDAGSTAVPLAPAPLVRQQRQQRPHQQHWQWLQRHRRPVAAAAKAAALTAGSSSGSGGSSNGTSSAAAAAQPSAASAASPPAATGAPPAPPPASLSLAELWALLRPDWRQLAVCAAFTAVSVTTAVLVAPSVGRVVDIISKGTAGTPAELATAVGCLGAVYICSNISLAVQVALALALGEGLAHRLRCRLFGALLQRDTLFFDRVKTGQMTAWLGQDIEVLQSTVAKLLGARGIRSAFETIGIILMLLKLSWPLAVALLVAAPLLTSLIAQLSRRIGAASKASQGASNDASAAADEIMENMRVVKLFAQQARELRRFQGLLDGAHGLALKVLQLQGLLDASSRLRNTLCVLCSLGLGSWMALNNAVTLGTCYSFFVFSFSFAFALGNLTNTVGDMARAAGAVSRTMATLREAMGDQAGRLGEAAPPAGDPAAAGAAAGAADGSTQQQDQQRRRLPDSWSGDIEFRDVAFSHPGGWSLEDVSFRIPAGKTVALVGPSGGGKSTIASMLMGLYSPKAGQILVDGAPLAELDMQWWRRQLGVVMQEPGLLTGRIADVIRYAAPDASDSEVEWAARAAQAHEFIARLPQGYQTTIGGASGQELSGGQRQRLAIARALLRRPRVLVLDEATSALDVETELGVTRELEAAGRGVSSLIIAHRLSTVRRADWIVVVAAGRVVEVGTHEQLMAQGGGVYRTLVSTAESKGQESWELPSAGAADAAGAAADGDKQEQQQQRC
ncbi:hypothetical protein ABPG75_013461 [Micractinium tetrahymenae]